MGWSAKTMTAATLCHFLKIMGRYLVFIVLKFLKIFGRLQVLQAPIFV